MAPINAPVLRRHAMKTTFRFVADLLRPTSLSA